MSKAKASAFAGPTLTERLWRKGKGQMNVEGQNSKLISVFRLELAFLAEGGCSAENFSAEQQKPRPLVEVSHRNI